MNMRLPVRSKASIDMRLKKLLSYDRYRKKKKFVQLLNRILRKRAHKGL
jgi:hypothetical protein